MKQTAAASRIMSLISRVVVALAVVFAVGGGAPGVAWAETVNSAEELVNKLTAADLTDKTITLGVNLELNSGATIELGTTGVTLDLGGKDLTISGTTQIEVNGKELTVQNGNIIATGRTTNPLFHLVNTSTLTMTSVVETGNGANDTCTTPGPVVCAESSTVNIQAGCTIKNNVTSGNGGALYINGGTLNISGGTISDNTSSSATNYESGGGAIYIVNGTLTMTNGAIQNNTAYTSGGAVHAINGSVSISGGEISGNKSMTNPPSVGVDNDWGGGGIYARNTSSYAVTISGNAKITGNTSYKGGGGILATSDTALYVTGGEISSNTATGHGGGIHRAGNGSTTISGGKITNNDTDLCGGGLFKVGDGDTEISSGTVSENTAKEKGGGLYLAGNGKLTVSGGTFEKNEATQNGGGIYKDGDGELTVSGGTFEGNEATQNGGGIYKDGNGNATFSNVKITKNTAGEVGGGVYLAGGGTTEINAGTDISTGNTAVQGGGVAINGATVTMNNGAISGNTATKTDWGSGGGGMFVTGTAMVSIKGGVISDNVSEGGGGGINVVDDNVTFNLEGGTVTGNIAKLHEGGGISIMKGKATFSSGTVTYNYTGYLDKNTQNTSYGDWGGGGIFISDQGGIGIFPNKTLVTDNTAGGFGGGVAACSTGRTYILDSIGIYGNNALGDHTSGSGSAKNEDHAFAADSPIFKNSGYKDYFSALFSFITNKMPDEQYENWTGSADGEYISRTGNDNPIIATSVCGLTAHPTGNIENPVLTISNNYSYTHGGGILNNGTVIYGSADQINHEITIGRALDITATKMLVGVDGESDLRRDYLLIE